MVGRQLSQQFGPIFGRQVIPIRTDKNFIDTCFYADSDFPDVAERAPTVGLNGRKPSIACLGRDAPYRIASSPDIEFAVSHPVTAAVWNLDNPVVFQSVNRIECPEFCYLVGLIDGCKCRPFVSMTIAALDEENSRQNGCLEKLGIPQVPYMAKVKTFTNGRAYR